MLYNNWTYIALYTQKSFEMNQDLHVELKIIKLLEENIIYYIRNPRGGNNFLKKTIVKLSFFTIKNFCSPKGTSKKINVNGLFKKYKESV